MAGAVLKLRFRDGAKPVKLPFELKDVAVSK
jgi:hypothetical protein